MTVQRDARKKVRQALKHGWPVPAELAAMAGWKVEQWSTGHMYNPRTMAYEKVYDSRDSQLANSAWAARMEPGIANALSEAITKPAPPLPAPPCDVCGLPGARDYEYPGAAVSLCERHAFEEDAPASPKSERTWWLRPLYWLAGL